MKKSRCIKAISLTVIFVCCSLLAQSITGEMEYLMKGEITAIDTAYNTVVIEVPLAGKLFTVAGPLSPEAVLEKGGRPAHLANFEIGDKVTVRWRVTDKGHIIKSLGKSSNSIDEARACAELYIRKHLISPSKVKFSGLSNGLTVCTLKKGPDSCTFEVKGWVESQNATGEVICMGYQCIVSKKAEEAYKVDEEAYKAAEATTARNHHSFVTSLNCSKCHPGEVPRIAAHARTRGPLWSVR